MNPVNFDFKDKMCKFDEASFKIYGRSSITNICLLFYGDITMSLRFKTEEWILNQEEIVS